MDRIKENLLYFIAMGVAGVLLVIVLVVGSVLGGSHNGKLNKQAGEIANLQNQIETQKAQVSAGAGSVVQSTSGIDLARKSTDDAIIKEFAQLVTTWNSYDTYMEMRKEVMEKYALSESDRFSTVFLPDYGSITDGDGVAHNLIDYAKISCEYRGMRSIVSGINSAMYSYFVIVTCAGGRDGNTGPFNVVFCCTVDGAGNISNLEAYTLT